ncbi:MAG: site-specific integrase [Bermanella sp.]
MKTKLTTTNIKQLEVREKAYEVVDTDLKGFLLRVQPTGRKTFYFSYRAADGLRKRIKVGSLGQITVAKARDLAEGHAADVTKGVDVQVAKQTNKNQATEQREKTLERFIDNYYKPWVLVNRKSGQEALDRTKRNFKDFYSYPLDQINVLLIEKWRTAKLEAGLQSVTVNRAVAGLRAKLSKAVEWNVIDEHPLGKLKPLRVDRSPKVRYLTDAEDKRLFAALEKRDAELKDDRKRGNEFRTKRGYSLYPDLNKNRFADRLEPMVVLSLKTGMRKGEVFDLEWPDVDLKRKTLTVRGENSKSSQTRHIPLSPSALDVLKNWKKQSADCDGLVFPSDDGGRLRDVKKSWTSLLKKAKINNFRWHDMRHDFASKLVMKGVPLNTVRELCGHADLNTTLRYAHLAPDHKADAVELLG